MIVLFKNGRLFHLSPDKCFNVYIKHPLHSQPMQMTSLLGDEKMTKLIFISWIMLWSGYRFQTSAINTKSMKRCATKLYLQINLCVLHHCIKRFFSSPILRFSTQFNFFSELLSSALQSSSIALPFSIGPKFRLTKISLFQNTENKNNKQTTTQGIWLAR